MFQSNISCSFHTGTGDYYDVRTDSVHRTYPDGTRSNVGYNIYYTTHYFEEYFEDLRNQSLTYSIRDKPDSNTDVLVSFYSDRHTLIGTSELSKYMAVGYFPIEVIIDHEGNGSKQSDMISYGSEITLLLNA